MKQILELSGVQLNIQGNTIFAKGKYTQKKLVVYPAMWKKPVADGTIFVSDVYMKYAKPYALKEIVNSL